MKVNCKTLYGDTKLIDNDRLMFRPAAYGIVISNNKILLCQTKSTGKLWFPGGGVNKGEKSEDAAIRELKEETGIDAKVDSLFTFTESFFYYQPRDEAYHSFSFFYLCSPLTDKLLSDEEVDPDEESEKPRWLDFKKIKVSDMQVGAEIAFSKLKEIY